MKVGDLVKWKDGSEGTVVISAVSDDEAFVNIIRSKDDSGWWPSKCFGVVTPAEPEPPRNTWGDGGLVYGFGGGGGSGSGGGGGGRVRPEPPKYSYVVIDSPIGPQRFHLVPGEELAIRFDVKWRGAETT